MALIKCRECGAKISTKAVACPQCGAKPVRTSGCAWLVLILFGLLVIPPMISGLNGTQRESETFAASTPAPATTIPKASTPTPVKQRGDAGEIIAAAKNTIRARLKDPDSAQFKDVQFGDSTKTGPAAYGWVNAKNAMGGYTGFQRFVSNGKTTLLESEDEGGTKEAWRQLIAHETTVWSSVADVPVVVDVKELIGKGEAEVAKILGNPTSRGKMDGVPELSYQGEKVVIDFVRGKAAWITISDLKNVAFAPSALGAVGLKVTTPTFGNANVIRWEPYEKWHYVGIFPLGDGKVDHIYIEAVAK